MISELLRKWFGLSNECASCEILRTQLEHSEQERKELLNRLLDKSVTPIISEEKEELTPITPQFIPWRVRQQMLEAEDRKTAQLLKQSAKEIADLEREVGLPSATEVDRGPSGGIRAQVK